MNPIVKWAGGKRSLALKILEYAPRGYNRYIEPFIGGGSMLFTIKPKEALVNDLNSELINMYIQVRENKDELKKLLDMHLSNHHKLGDKEYFYYVRDLDKHVGLNNLSLSYNASRFIYLNKAGYNGLYRVNSQGYFNVPLGRRKKLVLYDDYNISEVSEYLSKNNVVFSNSDYYSFVKNNVKKGDFVYFDPPYDVPEDKQLFTNYQKNGFNKLDQLNLFELCKYVDFVGAYFLLSNSYTEFIYNLYKENFNIHILNTKRLIGSNPKSRGNTSELIISNITRNKKDDTN